MKVLITGYGRMGKLIEKTLLEERDDAGNCPNQIAGHVDVENTDILNGTEKTADIIIDFSNPSLSDRVISYAKATKTPLLSGTTNMSTEQLDALKALGSGIPCIWASNYSFGINLFLHILPEITKTLDGWDIEVVETHHNKKVDAPSGTAKSLANAIDPDGEYKRVYGREGNCGTRTKKEIGMHALRGGTVVGEHRVSYFGNDEIFEITHRAESRQILVDGAIEAAKRLLRKDPGFYTMEDILFG